MLQLPLLTVGLGATGGSLLTLGLGDYVQPAARTLIHNKIVMRGFGPSSFPNLAAEASGLVTQGFGSKPEVVPVVEDVRQLRLRFAGQSGTKRREREQREREEVSVWAKLIEINGSEAKQVVRGGIRNAVDSETRANIMMQLLPMVSTALRETASVSTEMLETTERPEPNVVARLMSSRVRKKQVSVKCVKVMSR